ncbi:MAG TPA: galactose-1-phosphate uridylyltransferase [Nitrososphaeraceae archaeon]|jgi:UDPglucose--hexose-1-phosphate uridylyltransferase|nr:galactose-1-phosphate uridylyltransferase [Nitrososphaeraceae archaeon]
MTFKRITLGELRKDYVMDKFVIYPSNLDEIDKDNSSNAMCPYCPGNENYTPSAIVSLVIKSGILQRLSDSEGNIIKGWSVRVFNSNTPIITQNNSTLYTDKPLYSEPAYGYHQILVATPNHNDSFSNISVEQWCNVLLVLQDRIRWLYSQKKVTYVCVYINNGNKCGTKIDHSHINIVTFSEVPPSIESKALLSHRFVNENGNCPSCIAISMELDGPRQILATDNFIAFCPWASIYPFEFAIYPKKHSTTLTKISQKEIFDLAMILRSTLGGMSQVLNNPSFNLIFQLSPEKKNSRQFHWHIEIYPHIHDRTGLEKGFGVFVNSILPETAALKLGAAARKEIAKIVGVE